MHKNECRLIRIIQKNKTYVWEKNLNTNILSILFKTTNSHKIAYNKKNRGVSSKIKLKQN